MKINAINTNLYYTFGAKKQTAPKQQITLKQLNEEYPVKTLSEIKFKDDVAKDKGKNYTGRIQDNLSDGREYTLYYINGRLRASEMGDIKKEYLRNEKNKLSAVTTKTGKNTGNYIMSYYAPDVYRTSIRKQLNSDLYMSQTKTVYLKDKDGKQKTSTFFTKNDFDDTDGLIIDTIENNKAKKIKTNRRVGAEKDIQKYYMEKDKNGNIISVIKDKIFDIDYFEISRDKNGEIQHVEKIECAPMEILYDFKENHPTIYKG